MNKTLPLFLVFTLVVFLGSQSLVLSTYTDVSVSEAKQMIDDNLDLVILDVRTLEEYESGHIGNAILIPVSELEWRIDELDKEKRTLVYCRSGIRSATGSQILVDNGFQIVYNMLGGIIAWTDQGYPVYVKYSSIQVAINNANEGDTLFISSGIYYENVIVNKTVSLIGENTYSTFVEGDGTGTVLKITQNNVNVTGLTIRGSGSTPNVDAGIYLENVGYCTISGNRVLGNEFGISLEGSYQNAVSENFVTENYDWGIHLEYSSNHNTLVENFISQNRGGIDIHFSSHFNTISQNRIANGTYGMILNNADSNNISRNFMSHLELGICIQTDADYNIVSENNITDCSEGIELRQAHNNRFYHNTLKNLQQVIISTYGYVNFWDDGYPSGGNYWSDHVCNGNPSDGSQPYIIDENNIDHYPFQDPIGWLLLGDINNDGVVDIFDVVLAANAFSSQPGDSNWNQAADLNNDDVVDIFDIVLLANNFGKTT